MKKSDHERNDIKLVLPLHVTVPKLYFFFHYGDKTTGI